MAKKTKPKATKSKPPPVAEPQAAGPDPILLPPLCHLAESEQVQDLLTDLPADGTAVIDASQVEAMSSACALVVIAAAKQRSGVEPPVAIINPTPVFIDAFQDLGMFQEMMKMEFRT